MEGDFTYLSHKRPWQMLCEKANGVTERLQQACTKDQHQSQRQGLETERFGSTDRNGQERP
jgi:hypothetical protein